MKDGEISKELRQEKPDLTSPKPETAERDNQSELHARYQEQLRRMGCPGCGESGELFY